MIEGMPVELGRPDETTSTLASTLRIGDDCITIPMSDPVRPDVAETISNLRQIGVESRIISGDGQGPVNKLAHQLDIPAQAEMLPGAKLELLNQLKAAGHRPLMVGDGINDGPALAAAHASIAPGSASDVSQQAADAVFMGKSLMPVATAIKMARATMKVVRQNFGFAVLYNMFAVPLALAGLVTPLIAAVAMSVSSLIVIGNSLRLAKPAQ